MTRRAWLRLADSGGASAWWFPATGREALVTGPWPVRPRSFGVEELSLGQLQSLIDARKATAVSLVREYLARIKAIDRHGPRLNSIIELNPEALALAVELDQERLAKGRRGPLHGMPVLIKDNIDTHDLMMTTAGSLTLLGSRPPRDAFLVERLRAAGA